MRIYKITAALILLLISLSGCFHTIDRSVPSFKTLKKEDFQTRINNKKTDLFFLRNGNISMAVTNYGGRIVGLLTPDQKGNYDDIVLGYSSIKEYMNSNEVFHGALIGRFGNRIDDGKFILDGITYELPKNNGPNHLHGGPKGFHNVVWEVEQSTDSTITMHYLSRDGEMGYPGNLSVDVEYELASDNSLIIYYKAHTDKKTVINLTSHPFFNLKGEGNGTINDHILKINADYYTPVDSTLIPTGEIAKVSNTPFDFTYKKAIGKDLNKGNDQLRFANGYDHNFVLNKEDGDLSWAVSIWEPKSGRKMEILTEEPGMQFYGGNFMDGSAIGKSGKPYKFRECFVFEPQHFPDSPNHPNFPSTVLKKGDTFKSKSIYRFSTVAADDNE
ncbi:aldose epimerase family protein [Marinilabilia rubra]|uniref:Aldose 1-epimerase n=1 Tax=Marinilabilia rubra TaxID=2162893 RepID=A0A2U2B630_9BACT|nr:aldose epimerase family protein [Marinilabilia rubra]PWD98506.1 galactose-1-epimerase [Marinilabilia rubra]